MMAVKNEENRNEGDFVKMMRGEEGEWMNKRGDGEGREGKGGGGDGRGFEGNRE